MQRIQPHRRPRGRNIVLIGGAGAQKLADLLRQIETRHRHAEDLNILGLFADPKNIPFHMAPHIKWLGELSSLPAYLRHQHVDIVIITFPRWRPEEHS